MSKRALKKSKRRSKAVLPALGLTGLSLSLASGATASTGEVTTNLPSTSQPHELFVGEEEISAGEAAGAAAAAAGAAEAAAGLGAGSSAAAVKPNSWRRKRAVSIALGSSSLPLAERPLRNN